MAASFALTLLSLLAPSLAWQSQCIAPVPSTSYTAEIPSWLSENFTCIGSPIVWEARPSPGKGMGVFATRTLEPGDIILREPPIIKIIPPEFRNGVAYPLEQIELLLQEAFDALPEEGKEEVMSLHAHSRETENIDKVVAVFRSNAYIIGDNNNELGLFPKGARINHSCRPNTSQVWHEKLGKRVVRAIRHIEEGEELFATYIPLLHTHDARQKRLNQYGFKCTCSACTHDAAVSDKRRNDIRKAFEDFEPQLSLAVPKTVVARKKAQKNAQASLELARLVEEEGLADYFAKAYRVVAISHARIEKWEAATMWAHKSYQLRLEEDGDSPAAKEIQALTAHLLSTWEEDARNRSMGRK